MKKTKIKLEIQGNLWFVKVDGRLRGWLFSKLCDLTVHTKNREGEPVDLFPRVTTPPRRGRVVSVNHSPDVIPKLKAGGRVVKMLPPGVKKMKRSQEYGITRNS